MTYHDGDSLDGAVSRDGTDVHVGQVWKDRRRKPDSIFLIRKVYERHYPDRKDEKKRVRVMGVLSAEHDLQQDRTLDIESLRSIFPYLMFEPNKPERIEDK